jgi:RNA polymerase sigma-70 factor, ECF subfamily
VHPRRATLRLLRPASADAPAEGEIARPLDAPPTVEWLFRRYSAYVARIALRLLGRDDEVDDVVQDVFLGALRGLGELRDPEAARGWLATVTVRVARRKLRIRRFRAFFHLDPGADYEELAGVAATAEERALIARVYAILDGIPAERRIAWTLRYVEGEKLGEVARLCGCSLATVKRRIDAVHQAITGAMSDG